MYGLIRPQGRPEFSCANCDDMTRLRYNRNMFGMGQTATVEFEIDKAYLVFALAVLHALGSTANHHSLITNRETCIGMNMPNQYDAKAIKPHQTTTADYRFHLTGKSMAFNGSMQD